jgi:hypothetical protein
LEVAPVNAKKSAKSEEQSSMHQRQHENFLPKKQSHSSTAQEPPNTTQMTTFLTIQDSCAKHTAVGH